jgi:hypothetical protein
METPSVALVNPPSRDAVFSCITILPPSADDGDAAIAPPVAPAIGARSIMNANRTADTFEDDIDVFISTSTNLIPSVVLT